MHTYKDMDTRTHAHTHIHTHTQTHTHTHTYIHTHTHAHTHTHNEAWHQSLDNLWLTIYIARDVNETEANQYNKV